MSAANRRRGADAERAVVRWLRDAGWPDTRRYLAGDGRQPGDVDWHPLICLEVKDRVESAWPTWCRQAAAEARAGTIPVVVRRTRGQPDAGLWEARTPVDAWADIPLNHRWPQFWRVDGTVWVTTTLARVAAAIRDHDTEEAL